MASAAKAWAATGSAAPATSPEHANMALPSKAPQRPQKAASLFGCTTITDTVTPAMRPSVTPVDEVVVPPAAATPVLGLGTVGLVSLVSVMGLMGLRRARKSA